MIYLGNISGFLWLQAGTKVGKLQSWAKSCPSRLTAAGMEVGLPGQDAPDMWVVRVLLSAVVRPWSVCMFSVSISKGFNLFLYGLCSLLLI